MEALTLSLFMFIHTLTGLPVPAEQPDMEFRSAQGLWELLFPGRPYDEGSKIRVEGLYVLSSRTIYLLDDWDAGSLNNRAALAHEVTHYMSYMSQVRYACLAAREKEAYGVMKAYIEAQGGDFLEVSGINPVMLPFITSCGPRR